MHKSDDRYFISIFNISYVTDFGATRYKIISSDCQHMHYFEDSVNTSKVRFDAQQWEIVQISVLFADSSFNDEWMAIKNNREIRWRDKNIELAKLRPDITEVCVFVAQGQNPKIFAKA